MRADHPLPTPGWHLATFAWWAAGFILYFPCVNTNLYIFPGVSPQVGNAAVFKKKKTQLWKQFTISAAARRWSWRPPSQEEPFLGIRFLDDPRWPIMFMINVRIERYDRRVLVRIMATSMRMGCPHQPVDQSAFPLTGAIGGWLSQIHILQEECRLLNTIVYNMIYWKSFRESLKS